MSIELESIKMRVEARRELTQYICEFTLSPVDEIELPAFAPGSHITVETPSGAMRRYSLVNDGEFPENYVIAVKREPESRGGSSSMHESATVGTEIAIQAPENSFALKNASKYLLIAGGIGVTPIYAMANHLSAQGKPFEMIYCTRSAEETAYLDDIKSAFGSRVRFHHDNGDLKQVYDFWDHFEEPGAGHVYCCGPSPLMEEIKAISGHWPEGRVHFEDFKAVDAVREDDQPFEVTVANLETTITVPADRSVLEALRDNGIKTVSSCESGTCGTCRCKLIEGDVDHRDMVLMDEEKDSQIMICVSRAKEGNLVIEL
ncbi:MAG: PDR/VanB family oxidoreductase [Thalassospira sp.]|jgi:phthalate 4,5-dioxygenase reductase subunit|uniref:PDR/VanB family oxidoreductase n=1 Tax=Thalassospira sp. TaxID=1912094 RepID=UPI0032EC093E|tara:strand:- start:42374 stop:43324 length:951 start_codon:yes stop_codon:yes gene_type:complete